MRDEGEDCGFFDGKVVLGVEVGDGFGDLESVVGEDGGEFVCFEPVDLFGAFVGVEEGAVGGVEGVTMVADQEAGFGVEGVLCFDSGVGLVGEEEVTIVIPFVFRDLAIEFGVGDEGGEVEPAFRGEGAVEGEEEAGGIGDELKGEGGDGEGREPVGEVEGFDVAFVEGGVEREYIGLFAAQPEHLRGEVDALNVYSGGKEWEKEAAGAAAKFEGGAGVGAVEGLQKLEFGGAFLGVPKVIVELGFEGLVHVGEVLSLKLGVLIMIRGAHLPG